MPLDPHRERSPAVLIGLVVFSLFVLTYSIVIAGQLLLGVLVVLVVLTIYVTVVLFTRFVRALERLADAAETYADAQSRSTDRSVE